MQDFIIYIIYIYYLWGLFWFSLFFLLFVFNIYSKKSHNTQIINNMWRNYNKSILHLENIKKENHIKCSYYYLLFGEPVIWS